MINYEVRFVLPSYRQCSYRYEVGSRNIPIISHYTNVGFGFLCRIGNQSSKALLLQETKLKISLLIRNKIQSLVVAITPNVERNVLIEPQALTTSRGFFGFSGFRIFCIRMVCVFRCEVICLQKSVAIINVLKFEITGMFICSVVRMRFRLRNRMIASQ